MLQILTKQETKDLEQKFVPYENILNKFIPIWKPSKRAEFQLSLILASKLQSWYHKQNLEANVAVRKQFARASELLNHKPLYFVMYEFYNAVWGFEWVGENEKFILSLSLRGLEITVRPEFPIEKFNRFSRMLISTMYKKRKI